MQVFHLISRPPQDYRAKGLQGHFAALVDLVALVLAPPLLYPALSANLRNDLLTRVATLAAALPSFSCRVLFCLGYNLEMVDSRYLNRSQHDDAWPYM